MNIFIDLLIKGGLYNQISINNENLKDICSFFDGLEPIDLYCSECGRERLFKEDGRYDFRRHLSTVSNIDNDYKWRYITTEVAKSSKAPITFLQYKCTYDESHQLLFFFNYNCDTVQKVGQYPTYTDIDMEKAKSYRKILGEEYYREFKRAVGLFSHGVGIGSFVYLRRIIEKLLYDAFLEANTNGAITQEQFEIENGRKRTVDSKIRLLKGFLPDILVDNSSFYGIVSKGIHELSEDDCIAIFPILNEGIKLILQEHIERKEQENAQNLFSKAISKISSKLKP